MPLSKKDAHYVSFFIILVILIFIYTDPHLSEISRADLLFFVLFLSCLFDRYRHKTPPHVDGL